MKLFKLFLPLALSALLSACGHGHSSAIRMHVNFDDGSITLKKGVVIIDAKGHDTAYVTEDGKLVIGKTEVTTNTAGQTALADYNLAGQTFVSETMSLGKQGIHFAVRTLGQITGSLFNGSTEQAGKEAEAGGLELKEKAKALCQKFADWRTAQDIAAAAIPEFKPYALIGEKDISDCYTEDSKHDAADQKKSGTSDKSDDSKDAAPASRQPVLRSDPVSIR